MLDREETDRRSKEEREAIQKMLGKIVEHGRLPSFDEETGVWEF